MPSNKIVVFVQVSLDGRTAGPDGELSWFVVKDELHAHFLSEHSKAGMLLYGRRTYDGMAAYWPTADQDPDNDKWLIRYSAMWKPMPKAVFSRTMQSADWNTTVLPDVESLSRCREQANGDLYLVGSGELITELARRGQVDEYHLYVHPVALGRGPSLLQDVGRLQGMTFAGSDVFDDAVVKLTYRRAVQ